PSLLQGFGADGAPGGGLRRRRRSRGRRLRAHRGRAAAARARAARRTAARHRRIRRRGAADQGRRRPGGRPHLEQGRGRLRAAHRRERCAWLRAEGRALRRGARGVPAMTRWRTRAALWIIAVALAAASATAIALSDTVNHGFVAFALIVGGSFVATGLVALGRRPENRFGLLLYGVGLAWFVGTLSTSNNAYVFSVAQVFSTVYYALLVHAILAYPRGRLESRPARVIVVAAYLDTIVPNLLVTLVGSSHDLTNNAEAPRNALLVSHHPDLAS